MNRRVGLLTKESSDFYGVVLYVIGPDRGPVKIGISASTKIRLGQLQTGHPYELSVLAEVAVPFNGEESEASIHQFFEMYRTRPNGEWFNRSREVERFIEMAYCRLSPDLIMEKLRASRQRAYKRRAKIAS